MDTYIDKMAHAFYTILGLMAENLPDCGDEEYVKECSKTWFNALTEFKEAEQTARNLNEDTSGRHGCIDGFKRLVQLVSFLDSSTNKDDKALEIKMAREDGLITSDEAIELTVEFC